MSLQAEEEPDSEHKFRPDAETMTEPGCSALPLGRIPALEARAQE